MFKDINEIEQVECNPSTYCEKCKCCAEFPCCGIEKFLNGHTKECKYHKVYKREIIDSITKVASAENIFYGIGTYEEKFKKLLKVFEIEIDESPRDKPVVGGYL